MRPTKLEDIVGQTKIKQTLGIMVKSAKIRDKAVGHIMFSGPSGRGKTTFARAIAHELGKKLYSVVGKSIKTPAELAVFLISKIQKGDILFIDEIHGLSSAISEWLYIVMEDFIIIKPDGSKFELPEFTIVGATTHIGNLPKPFRDRFKFVAELEEYSEDDLLKIAAMVCKKEKINLSENALKILVKTSRFTPRLIINRVEFINDYIVANEISTVRSNHILEVLKMQGVDENGLTMTDRKYLDVLRGWKPVSLKQLAARIEVNEATILNEIEPFLLKKNLVEITNKGRVLVLAGDNGKTVEDLM